MKEHKFMSLLLTMCIAAAAFVIPVYASDAADAGYDWNACACLLYTSSESHLRRH